MPQGLKPLRPLGAVRAKAEALAYLEARTRARAAKRATGFWWAAREATTEILTRRVRMTAVGDGSAVVERAVMGWWARMLSVRYV